LGLLSPLEVLVERMSEMALMKRSRASDNPEMALKRSEETLLSGSLIVKAEDREKSEKDLENDLEK